MLTFKPTRTSQPHRDPFQAPSAPLMAMLSGRPLHGPNPMDYRRQMQRLAAMLAPR